MMPWTVIKATRMTTTLIFTREVVSLQLIYLRLLIEYLKMNFFLSMVKNLGERKMDDNLKFDEKKLEKLRMFRNQAMARKVSKVNKYRKWHRQGITKAVKHAWRLYFWSWPFRA